MARIMGRRTSSAKIIEETGLPGKPRNSPLPKRPKMSGFPGRIAIFQKFRASPWLPKPWATKSCLPTDAPPVVTTASNPVKRAATSSTALERVANGSKINGFTALGCHKSG